MCPFNDYLLNYHEIDGGNNVVCRVVGMGNVNLKLHDVTIRKLKEVRHVPELKRHLFSLWMLDQISLVLSLNMVS